MMPRHIHKEMVTTNRSTAIRTGCKCKMRTTAKMYPKRAPKHRKFKEEQGSAPQMSSRGVMCTDAKYVTRISNPARQSDGVDRDHEHAPDAANRRDADEERIEPESQNLEKHLGLKAADET